MIQEKELPPDIQAMMKRLPRGGGSLPPEIEAMASRLPTAGDYAQSVVSGLGRGAFGAIEGAMSGAYRLAHAVLPEALRGPEPEDESILGGLRSATESFQPNEAVQRAGGAGRFLAETLPEGLGSTAVFLLPGGAAARLGRGAALGASALTGAMVSAEQGYKDALRATGDERKAWTAYVLNLPGGAAEALDVGIAGDLFRWNKKLGGLLKPLLVDAAAEGLQEGAQGLLADTIHEKLTGEEREKLKRFAESALVGSAVGGILGGAGRAVRGSEPTPDTGVRIAEAMDKVRVSAEKATGSPEKAVSEFVRPSVPEPIPEAAQLVGMEGVAAKQVEPHDPFLAKAQELQEVSTRMDELAAQSKDVRQKGRPQESTPIDTERIALLKRQQEIALEMQGIAAERRGPATEAKPELPKKSIGDKAKLRAETLDLQSFVRSVGGIRGDTPEGRLLYGGLADKEAGRKFGLGPIVRSPKSVKGQNWEHVKEKAFEAGYFPGHERSADVTFQEFADALTENRKHPERAEFEAAREAEAEDRYHEAAEAHYREQFPEEAAAWDAEKLADLPDEARRIVYHGTPHEFESFSEGAIGTGEGQQAFGHGLYFTDKKEIAEHYRKSLSNKDAGTIHEVALAPKDDELLDWNKPFSEQSDKVKRAVAPWDLEGRLSKADLSGAEMYSRMMGEHPDRAASADVAANLRGAGVRGIRYKADQGKGGTNYVIFSDKDVEIVRPGDTSFDPSAWEPDLHAAVTEQTGDPKIADAEVAATKAAMDLVGEPPGPPKPPVPIEELPPAGDPSFLDLHDHWQAERQLADAYITVQGAKWSQRVRSYLKQSLLARGKEAFKARAQQEVGLTRRALFRYIDLKGKLEEQVGKFGGKLPEEEIALLERARNLPPQMRELADEMLAVQDKFAQLGLDEEVLTHLVENHIRRTFDRPQDKGEAHAPPAAKFMVFTKSALPRTLESYLEGVAKGYKLVVDDGIDAMVTGLMELKQVVLDRKYRDSLERNGLLGKYNVGGDWKPVEHPGFRGWRRVRTIPPQESAAALQPLLTEALGHEITFKEAGEVQDWMNGDSQFGIYTRGMLLKRSPDGVDVKMREQMYAPKEVAQALDNALTGSKLRAAERQTGMMPAVSRSVRDFGVTAKAIMTVAIQDNIVISTVRHMLGAPAGLKNMGQMWSGNAYRDGWKMLEAMTPEVELLVGPGELMVKPAGEWQQYLDQGEGRLVKKLQGFKLTSGVTNALRNTFRAQAAFYFNRFLPAVKTHLAVLEYRRLVETNRQGLMDGKITKEQLAKAAGRLSNNLHSGQNVWRQGTNPTLYDVATRLPFAIDWTHSTLKTATDLFRAGATGAAHRHLWARMMGRYALAWTAFNLATAAMADPDDPFGEFGRRRLQAWKLGTREFLGVDVNPLLASLGRKNPTRIYVGIMGTADEPFRAVTEPFKYGGSKLGVVPRLAIGMFTGKDGAGKGYTTTPELLAVDDKGVYQNTQIGHHYRGQEKGGKLGGQLTSYSTQADPGAIGMTQVPSFVADTALRTLPIQLQDIVDWIRGQQDGWEAGLRFLGARVSSPSAKRQEAAGIPDVQGPSLDHGKQMRARYLRAAELGAN